MDPLGLVDAAVAALLYPGGVYLAALALAVRWGGGLPGGLRAIRLDAVAALVAVDLAAALAPMSGSPVASLPPDRGVTSNAVAVLMLLVVATVLAAPSGWGRWRLTAAVGLCVSWMSLAVGAASVQLPVIAGVPDSALAGARWCSAAAMLLATPIVSRPFDDDGVGGARVVLTAALLMMALSVALAGTAVATSAPLEASVLLAAGGAYGLLLRWVHGRGGMERGALVAASLACASAATALALVVARP